MYLFRAAHSSLAPCSVGKEKAVAAATNKAALKEPTKTPPVKGTQEVDPVLASDGPASHPHPTGCFPARVRLKGGEQQR